MPSKIIDQIHLSPLHMPSPPASFFSQEPHFPSERQIGLWKGEFAGDNCGTKAMPLFSGNKADSSSPLEKHRPVGGNMAGCLELPQTYLFKEQKTKIGLKHSLMGTESTIGVHRTSWRAPNQDYGSRSSIYGQQTFQLGDKVNSNGIHYENGLFSSSLSETFSEKLSLPSNDVSFGRSMDTTNFNFGDDERTLEEIEAQTIGNLLPNDEDLLSGIIDDRDYIVRTSSGGDIEDDLFCSVGGMELEVVDSLNSRKASDFVGGGSSYCKLGDFSGPFAGEHVYREHPSRALSVRNINSNVKDAERRDHFEIREAPHKHHHKFIDFYDVRASEASLHALNNSDIAGKRVQLDPSQHGGAIQSLMPQLSPKQHGISSSLPYSLSSPMRSATVSSQSYQNVPGDLGHSMGQINFSYHCSPAYHPHSLPESHGGITNGIPFSSPSTIQAMDIINSRPVQGVGSGSLNTHSFEHHEGAYGGLGNGSCPLHGHHYVMTSPGSYHHPPGSMMWQNSPAFTNNISHPPPGMHGLPRAPSHALSLHNHHHVGSAPTVNPSPWDRWHAYGGDTFETSTFHPAFHPLEIAPSNIFPHAGRNCIDPSMSPAHVGGFPSSQQRCHIFHGKNTMSSSYDAPNDRVRSRRSDANANQAENRKQYELDIDRIMHGEETRTTLMIKNIPNKYTSKMLLATIDEHHRGAYDFIYLPIDFKNKCNVGYAFINMVDPQHIVPFYKAFNGKKWEKFNSEKVASLAYARIQGREALIAHFQNSSLMNEDKRCRPILFHTDGPNAGDQEPFPMGANIRSRSGRPRSAAHEATHQGSPATSANGEESSNAVDSSSSSSSSGSTKETE